MSAEHRENRPLKEIPGLDALVGQMKLYVGDRAVLADTTATISEDVFLHAPFVLRLAADESALRSAVERAIEDVAASPYDVADVALVVVASSSYLKIAEPLAVIDLSELADKSASLVLTAGARPKAMRSPRAGCEVEVTGCLTRERAFKPLQAWRRWTWLSRTVFTVESEASFGGFVPLPLDQRKLDEFGLPSGTMRYIVIDSEISVASPASSEDSLQLYVDADLLALISANDKSASSKLLQRILFLDAISAVVNRAVLSEDIADLTPDDIKGSLLEIVIRMASGPDATPSARAAMLDLLREQPAAFMAQIERAASLLSGAHDSLGGAQ
jgi:hypothetical protein